jgi:hypothetical protein
MADLQRVPTNVATLLNFITICSACKKIRNAYGEWEEMENYIHEHADAEFTHGICPSCLKELYPQFYKQI